MELIQADHVLKAVWLLVVETDAIVLPAIPSVTACAEVVATLKTQTSVRCAVARVSDIVILIVLHQPVADLVVMNVRLIAMAVADINDF